jgi:diguanylate cyclase (GGDEF)-like protein
LHFCRTIGRVKSFPHQVLAWLLWLTLCLPALAQPQAVLRLDKSLPEAALVGDAARWWIDDSGRRSIDDVAQDASIRWSPRRAGEQHAIDGKAWWLRFDAVAPEPGRWFLQLHSSGLDRAQLFYRDTAGIWVVQEAGDTRSVAEWPLPGRVPTFELAPGKGEPVRYWLRVEHARVDFAVPIAIVHQARLMADREQEQFMLGAYFGLSVLITLVALASAIRLRDRGFATYAVYVATLGLGQAAYLGVGAQHLWPEALAWNEVATFLLPGVSSAAALWFVRTVTEPARFSRILDLAVWGMIAALLCAVVLDTVLASRASFGLQLMLTAIALGLIVVLIVFVWLQGTDPNIRFIALGFLPVLVMAVFPVLRGLNLIPNSPLTRYGIAIGAMLEMPILYYALSLRGARRRESEVRAAALSHTDTLTGLPNAQTLRNRLQAAIARARSQHHPCALLAVRISNTPAIIHEFGHGVLEKCLVVAASQLRQAASEIDLPARIGDVDFALLLEGPTTTTLALARAQQLVAHGLRQAEALPAGLILRYHVAVALLPEHDLDAEGSIRWVLDGATAMRPDARKLIKPLNF